MHRVCCRVIPALSTSWGTPISHVAFLLPPAKMPPLCTGGPPPISFCRGKCLGIVPLTEAQWGIDLYRDIWLVTSDQMPVCFGAESCVSSPFLMPNAKAFLSYRHVTSASEERLAAVDSSKFPNTAQLREELASERTGPEHLDLA